MLGSKKTKRLNYFADPGHGWVAVKRSFMVKVGVNLLDITPYSYQSKTGKTVYLEEDCDVMCLFIAMDKAGYLPEFKYIRMECGFVTSRTLEGYQP